MLPRVTIIGRPNVGKSSLFNALTGHRIAIVSDKENTTRDIIEYQIDDAERESSYILADSGGIVEGDDETILGDVRARVDEAISLSDLILFVLEYDRVTEWDERIARRLRKSHKPLIIVANKADNPKRDIDAYNLLELGLGDVIPVSPMQTRGLDRLKNEIIQTLRSHDHHLHLESLQSDDTRLKLAIIGRPNVGKSSLVNAISGETRSIVKDLPGTTRDTIDTVIFYTQKEKTSDVPSENHEEMEQGTLTQPTTQREIVLIDTAGIRRAGKIGSGNIEDWSVMRAERSIERADIIAVVMDAFDGVSHQDEVIVGKAIQAKKGIILVLNKWDKVLEKPNVGTDTILDRYMHYLSKKFDFLSYAPVIFTSAIENRRIDIILDHALNIYAERRKRVKTGVFNKFLEQITYEHAPTGNKKSHKPKIYYGSQVDIAPPRFVISVNNAQYFHFSYLRYIENKIRQFFGFEGTPIEIELKSRKSIYKDTETHGSEDLPIKKNSRKHATRNTKKSHT